jgi:hypothetical protein
LTGKQGRQAGRQAGGRMSDDDEDKSWADRPYNYCNAAAYVLVTIVLEKNIVITLCVKHETLL